MPTYTKNRTDPVDRDDRDELMFRLAVGGLLVAVLALTVAVAALIIAT